MNKKAELRKKRADEASLHFRDVTWPHWKCFWTWPFGHVYDGSNVDASRCVGCGKPYPQNF